MDIQDFINNAIRIRSIEDRQEVRFVLTKEQKEVLNTINNNENILIKKKIDVRELPHFWLYIWHFRC